MTETKHDSDEPYWLRTVRQIVRKHKHESEKQEDVKPVTSIKDTKFCYDCGKKISLSAKFCEHCGAKQPVL